MCVCVQVCMCAYMCIHTDKYMYVNDNTKSDINRFELARQFMILIWIQK